MAEVTYVAPCPACSAVAVWVATENGTFRITCTCDQNAA